jgi:hypothetical protein
MPNEINKLLTNEISLPEIKVTEPNLKDYDELLQGVFS